MGPGAICLPGDTLFNCKLDSVFIFEAYLWIIVFAIFLTVILTYFNTKTEN